jgi:hypothetical protein
MFAFVHMCTVPGFRLYGVCKPCPNTAWLLFLIAAILLIAIVAASVYLSKRRLNLAVLGIGMVSV